MKKEIKILSWFYSFFITSNKLDFILFIFTALIVSIIEVMSIASIIPFLEVVLSENMANDNKFVFLITEYFKFQTREELVVFLITIFLSLLFLSSLTKILIVIFVNHIQRKVGSKLSNLMYSSIINNDYLSITKKNSSDFLSVITEKAELTKQSIFNILNSISSLILLCSLIIFILFITPNFSFLIFILILFIFLLIIFLTKKILSKQSLSQSKSIFERFKIVNETYGIIREIIIDNSQEFFKNKYKKSDDKFRKAQFVIGIISGIPKFIIEYILILIIFIFVYNLLFTYNYNSSHVLPLVSSFAFVAYRSMPLLNNIYSSIAQISGYKESVLEGINLLNEIKLLKKQNHEDLTNSNIDLKFNLSLSLKNVNFTYPDNSAKVLKNININLEKGKIYGIKGSSGTGKSTLLNIISGLIIPTQGKLFVDNTLINKEKINLWRNKVSLVSQSNFFLDETIFENLTISSNINDEQKLNLLVNSSLKTSVLEDFIKNLPNGVHSKIGDNAVRISGGQKQRLAIARALCKKPECLMLDESTSGLDIENEQKLIENLINIKSKMLIVLVSHKKQTLEFCDEIIDLDRMN